MRLPSFSQVEETSQDSPYTAHISTGKSHGLLAGAAAQCRLHQSSVAGGDYISPQPIPLDKKKHLTLVVERRPYCKKVKILYLGGQI